jgi:diacylglycerol O-acyltransferase / wax synthase
MAQPNYERLSAMDSSFLVFEGPNTHMNIGGTAVFEAGPLATASGGVDIERIRRYIGSRLHLVPRYRQRLAFVPIENRPVWVDDDHFNLDYHVRHTSLPRPGDEGQLKRLTGRIMSQQLDRRRPLWEAWVVEGLADGRFALISKVHHCMVDGVSGVDLLAALLKSEPDEAIEEPPRWVPRPPPTPFQLLRDELLRRAETPFTVRDRLTQALQDPEGTGTRLLDGASAVFDLLRTGLRLPAGTPLNLAVGPHRRFDWLTLDLEDVKEVKNRLRGTVNDVVLATVAGAVRRLLMRHRVDVRTLEYRAAVPVSVRAAQELGTMGNRVSAWLTPIPIQEADPLRRFNRVRDTTARLKEAKQSLGAEVLEELAEWAGSSFLTLGVRLASWVHPYHLIVTNVPGPQMPLYLLGARMRVGYPVVPLFENQGLGVAVFSYTGQLCWGINADWDMIPGLHEFVSDIRNSFAELHRAALGRRAHHKAPPSRSPGKRKRAASRALPSAPLARAADGRR